MILIPLYYFSNQEVIVSKHSHCYYVSANQCEVACQMSRFGSVYVRLGRKEGRKREIKVTDCTLQKSCHTFDSLCNVWILAFEMQKNTKQFQLTWRRRKIIYSLLWWLLLLLIILSNRWNVLEINFIAEISLLILLLLWAIDGGV